MWSDEYEQQDDKKLRAVRLALLNDLEGPLLLLGIFPVGM